MPLSRDQVTFFDKELKPESLSDVLRIHDQKMIELLRKSLQKNNRVSTSTLQSSLIAEHDVSPSYVSLKIMGEKYWQVVDKGRKPGGKAPPHDAMLEFISNRKIVPEEGKTPQAYKSLAYVLGQAIKKKGIKPTNFVSEAITDKEIKELKKDILKAVKKGLL